MLPVLWFIYSILAAAVNLSHSECEKRTKFAQTTDSFTVVFSACKQFDYIRHAWLEPHGKVQNYSHTHIWVSHEASVVEVQEIYSHVFSCRCISLQIIWPMGVTFTIYGTRIIVWTLLIYARETEFSFTSEWQVGRLRIKQCTETM